MQTTFRFVYRQLRSHMAQRVPGAGHFDRFMRDTDPRLLEAAAYA